MESEREGIWTSRTTGLSQMGACRRKHHILDSRLRRLRRLK